MRAAGTVMIVCVSCKKLGGVYARKTEHVVEFHGKDRTRHYVCTRCKSCDLCGREPAGGRR